MSYQEVETPNRRETPYYKAFTDWKHSYQSNESSFSNKRLFFQLSLLWHPTSDKPTLLETKTFNFSILLRLISER